MKKGMLFISHIAEEKAVALAIKKLIEPAFIGMLDVFVSSDDESIHKGDKWLEDIAKALKKCDVKIIVCSPKSVNMPWINFEAGAGWIRDIPVIPICHSGIEPSSLPLPLNLLQGARATEVRDLEGILRTLAACLGSELPQVDFATFLREVAEFEKQYTFWNECNVAFRQIFKLNPELVDALKKATESQEIVLQLTETQVNRYKEIMPFLEKNDLLQFERIRCLTMSPDGAFYGCKLIVLSRLPNTIRSPEFRS